jgi:hypothetical protein
MHNVTHFLPRHFAAAFFCQENTMTVKEYPTERKIRGRVQIADDRRPTVTEYKISILWGLYTLEQRKVTS